MQAIVVEKSRFHSIRSDQNMVVKEESGMITVQIQLQEAGRGCQRLSFATERSLPLQRVSLDFCDRLDLVYNTVGFLDHEGKHLNERQTAEECKLEDGDIIDAFYGMVGAGPITLTSTPY